VPEAFRLAAELLPLRNIIVIYNSYNPQTSAPDTMVVGRLVTVRPGIIEVNFGTPEDDTNISKHVAVIMI